MTLTLGIDLGTSKIAAVLFDVVTASPVAVSSVPADTSVTGQAGWAEQDPKLILDAVDRCILDLPLSLRKKARAVGVTGQMHGVLLFDSASAHIENLITWQDTRCSETFLKRICPNESLPSLKSGYGCATLAWLSAYDSPRLRQRAWHCATIHDYLVYLLCGLTRPIMDHTDAASFGFFNTATGHWEQDRIELAGIPVDILPQIVPVGAKAGGAAGRYAQTWGIPEGVPVMAAIGDNQASLYATLIDPATDIAITLGTGGQVSVITHAADPGTSGGATYEYRPYVDGRFAAVAASLCGGSAYAWLANVVCSWLHEFGIDGISTEEIYSRLGALGMESKAEGLRIHPHFLGERFDPLLRGSIEGIDLRNFSLGSVSSAVARGIIENLKGMLPDGLLAGRTRIVGSGNAVRRSPLLRKCVEEVFALPLVIPDASEEAATGAARLAQRLL